MSKYLLVIIFLTGCNGWNPAVLYCTDTNIHNEINCIYGLKKDL